MFQTMRRAEVLLVAGLLGIAPSVQAQGFNFNQNLNPSLVSGLNQAQYMALLQQAALAGAANPYSPLTSNPYAAATTNPYNSLGSGYGTGYTNPYLPYADSGSVLRGEADVMRAYGNVITSQEQARVIREQALQARLETRRKKFDLDMYIKANTPTFTEEQAKIAKMTLRRIQTNSSEPEIVNGSALNLLLDDMRKHSDKKADKVEPFALSEDVLAHLNVTGGNFSLSVLRNRGDFIWPIVFQENFPPDQLRLVSNQAKTLVSNAEKGKISPDVNVLKDLRNEIDQLRDQLSKKINDVPTNQWLEGSRFLKNLDDARLALEGGEGLKQVNFQKWASGGKTLQQLVDYMVANGLRFTGSAQGDEFAYRAAYSGMVALDVNLNTQYPANNTESVVERKENP